ncbi:dolichyl-phosphate beta-glucosyltransferase [Ranunculus cassubicifolius]
MTRWSTHSQTETSIKTHGGLVHKGTKTRPIGYGGSCRAVEGGGAPAGLVLTRPDNPHISTGSADRTSKVAFELVKKYSIDNVRVLLLRKNQGKGEAIRKGMLHARGELLLMLDADGATKIDDLEKL